MNSHIRRATLEDLDGLHAVENAAFPSHLRYSKELFRRRLSGKPDGIARERVYFVACDKTDIVGYGEVAIETPSAALFGNVAPLRAMCELDAEIGVLVSMAVHPSAQGRGVGKSLVHARTDYLRSQGLRQVVTHAWPNGGFPRIADALGFVMVPDWEGKTYEDGSSATLYYRSLEDGA